MVRQKDTMRGKVGTSCQKTQTNNTWSPSKYEIITRLSLELQVVLNYSVLVVHHHRRRHQHHHHHHRHVNCHTINNNII